MGSEMCIRDSFCLDQASIPQVFADGANIEEVHEARLKISRTQSTCFRYVERTYIPETFVRCRFKLFQPFTSRMGAGQLAQG